MKKGLIAVLVFLLVGVVALFGCTQDTSAAEYGSMADDETYGSAGALADSSLTLEEMLTYAIQDEYLAHAEYEYILETFGDQPPFSNIVLAEEQHIETLLGLYETYGFTVPEDLGAEHVVVPASITEALETGVQAEIVNIAMYESFLDQELPDDVRVVFTSLMEASEQHLAAFRNALDRKSGNSSRLGDGVMQQGKASDKGSENGTAQQLQISQQVKQCEDSAECGCTACTDSETQSRFQYAYGRDAE